VKTLESQVAGHARWLRAMAFELMEDNYKPFDGVELTPVALHLLATWSGVRRGLSLGRKVCRRGGDAGAVWSWLVIPAAV